MAPPVEAGYHPHQGQRCTGPESSALLNHGTSRGGVQLLLDEPEARAQLKHVSESRGEARPHEEEVPQAGPSRAVLLEHQRQLKGGHHRGIVGDPLQLLAAFLHLQVDVEDAAAQAAGLAGSQAQHLAGYPTRQLLWNQDEGAVQRCFLGTGQAAFKHFGQLVTGSVLCDIRRPLWLSQAVIPEIQLYLASVTSTQLININKNLTIHNLALPQMKIKKTFYIYF